MCHGGHGTGNDVVVLRYDGVVSVILGYDGGV